MGRFFFIQHFTAIINETLRLPKRASSQQKKNSAIIFFFLDKDVFNPMQIRMATEIIDQTTRQEIVQSIADEVVHRLRGGPVDLPYYLTAQGIVELLDIKHPRNIPADLPRYYPAGRKRNPLFRRDQVIAYVENNNAKV